MKQKIEYKVVAGNNLTNLVINVNREIDPG